MQRVALTNGNGHDEDEDEDDRPRSRRNHKGLFKKNDPRRWPGRKLGTPNKVSAQLKHAIVEAAAMVGVDGEGHLGLHGYLARLAMIEPQVFGRMLEKLLPMQINSTVRDSSQAGKYETLAQLAEALRQRGLPPPAKLIDITPRHARRIEAEQDRRE